MPDKTQTQSDCETELSFGTNRVSQPLEAIKLHPSDTARHSVQADLNQSFQPNTPENFQGNQELLHTLSTMSTQSGYSTGSRPDSSAHATTGTGSQSSQPQRFPSEASRQLSGDSCQSHHSGVACVLIQDCCTASCMLWRAVQHRLAVTCVPTSFTLSKGINMLQCCVHLSATG